MLHIELTLLTDRLHHRKCKFSSRCWRERRRFVCFRVGGALMDTAFQRRTKQALQSFAKAGTSAFTFCSSGHTLWTLSWVTALWEQATPEFSVYWRTIRSNLMRAECLFCLQLLEILHFLFFCSILNNNSVEIMDQKMKCHRALQDFTQSDEEEAVFGWCIKKHPAAHRTCGAHTHNHKIYTNRSNNTLQPNIQSRTISGIIWIKDTLRNWICGSLFVVSLGEK